MRNQLVYDLPLRIFHWAFAGLFVGAFLITKTVDDESTVFSWHMLAGLMLGLITLLRLLWGIFGSQHSRFSSFALRPSDVYQYFSGIFSGDQRKWAGHNPASSWAALILMGLALGLAVTGILMATGSQEAFHEIHEVLANAFLIVALLHIAGVVLHMIRHQDGLAFSMMDGRKSQVLAGQSISGARPFSAGLFVLIMVLFAGYLERNFDASARTLNLFGAKLELSAEDEGGENEGDEGHEDSDQDDD